MIKVTRYYYSDDEAPGFIISDDEAKQQVILDTPNHLYGMIVACFKAMTEKEMNDFLTRQMESVMAAHQTDQVTITISPRK